MKTDLDHLPQSKQHELERIQHILLEEFAAAIASATASHKRKGKVLKVILFGSFARDDWVDEPENGYQSDYDLLIVVSHADLTDIADYWYVAEDRIMRDPAIARPVNIIVHSLNDVNQALQRGEYFWVDIARDGIALYELPCHPLTKPRPLTQADAYSMAADYFARWFGGIDDLLAGADLYRDRGNPSLAAFSLHQATERAYATYLLVHTLYFPRSHNIKFLRSLAEDKESRLIAAWPRDTKSDRRRFELLKRAYVEARYSPSYSITADDLTTLAGSVARLRDIVAKLCGMSLAELKHSAGL